MKTINVTVLTVSARIYCHYSSNCSEITTGHIFCVLTDSVLRFPLAYVCIDMTGVAIERLGLYLLRHY